MRTERTDSNGKSTDERPEERAGANPVEVDPPDVDPAETGASVDGAAGDRSSRVGRRRMLQAMGAVGVAGVAGCLGGSDTEVETEESDHESSDLDEGDEAEESDDELGDHDEGDETTEEEPGDSGGSDEDSEDTRDVLPSELDLEPDDAWNDDHPDVEIPDEPGRAVLLLGDNRFELEGDFSGGPMDSIYDTITEADEFEGSGSYFFTDGLFQVTDETWTDHGLDEEGAYNVRFFRQMVHWFGHELTYMNTDRLELHWPGLMTKATHAYHELADGSTEDRDAAGTTNSEEPFLRIDSTGIVTATGTITDPGQSEIPENTAFEFGARADEQWVERWGEGGTMR